MEGIESFDRSDYHGSAYASRRTDSRRCSPGLPTPEASRSSAGSIDEQYTQSLARRGAPVHAMLSRENPDRFGPSSEMAGQVRTIPSMRRDSRHYSAPQSPPYQAADMQKPSLPPLKTILGEPFSSPPDTPRTHDTAFQPSPREPAFAASTFKPPALYPNKKPRIELMLEPSPAFNTGSTMSSPGMSSASLTSTHGYPRHRLGTTNAQRRPLADFDGSRRMSLQPMTAAGPEHFSSGTSQLPRLDHPFAQEARRPSEVAAVRTIPYHARPSPKSRPSYGNERYAVPPDWGSARQPSLSGYADYRAPQPRSADQDLAMCRDGHYNYAASKEPHRYERPRHENMDVAPMYGRPSFPDSQPAFFMPSHYDYQQGKTRKRSNLPKQSTEIMKTWFDQNISNPYPSEEQKAIFSSATNISMTQVSNWFINHRRRCPELRDKRDKLRVGGDGSD